MNGLKTRWVAVLMVFTVATTTVPQPANAFFIFDAIKCLLAGKQGARLVRIYNLYKQMKTLQRDIESEITAFKEMEEDWMGYIEDVSDFVDGISSSQNILDLANNLLAQSGNIGADIDRTYLTPGEVSILDQTIEDLNLKIEESIDEMNMILANTDSSGFNNTDKEGDEQTRFTDEERIVRVEASLEKMALATKLAEDISATLKSKAMDRKAKKDGINIYNNYFND